MILLAALPHEYYMSVKGKVLQSILEKLLIRNSVRRRWKRDRTKIVPGLDGRVVVRVLINHLGVPNIVFASTCFRQN